MTRDGLVKKRLREKNEKRENEIEIDSETNKQADRKIRDRYSKRDMLC